MSAPCTGAILAGGPSTRFGGEPKGLERVGGQRLIDRAALALSQAADALLLIANDPLAEGWLPGVPVAGDVRPRCGSLGGIHAALVRAAERAPGAAPAVLVLAWDMPFVPPGLLRALRALGEGGADAAVPESGSRRGVEPLCAWYAPSCLPAIERALDAGDRRAIAFFDRVRVARMPAAEVARHGDPARLFLNVNSPDELALAERHASTPDPRDRRHEEAR
ncbi:MAG TPA: molybdenum cofactor guanylyltransferase [Gemmatimonadaceae bacterium]|nr:molybdenum cofactor guanylyltransferase [Gemmatimonadaceae bacterium]